LDRCVTVPELSIKDLERGVLVATFLQGSLGLVRICLGDVFSGCYTLLLATLGYNARHPGPASNWLQTYVLITFINGTMSTIDLVQAMLQQNFPVLLLTLPLSKNLAHAVSLLVPGASFLGAYCGWQHIKMQKKLAMEAYYQQVEYMLQNPPWPPPPLPMQIVQNMVMQYSAGALQEAGLAQLEDGSIVDARTGTPIEQLMPELADMMAGASDPDVLWAHRDALKDRLPTLREEEEDFAEEAGGKRGEPRGAQTSPSVQLPPTSMSAPAIAMEANTLGY